MKFTLSWLKEYLKTDAVLEEICDKLTDIGLEVEAVDDKSKALSSFFVAKIIETSPHPSADKLQICQVDIGTSQHLQIICGASNARKGLKVVYAPIGSIIPVGSMKIRKSKIRGVESYGMLCSAAELELGCESEGIIEIDNQVSIGTKLTELYNLEAVIEVNITPNRGDCLGVYGIARDLAAAGIGTLKELQINAVKGAFSSPIKIQINPEANKECSYFSGYYIKNVTNKESPKWLKEKLQAIDVNPISAIVDITNYVMYCLNHPLHAYDAAKIKGNIAVRKANKGENFQSLKDLEYKLSGEELVIADNSGTIGLAGVIGGQSTSCQLNSTDIFLEAAFFEPENIAQTGRKLNILSDSGYRFERAIDIATVKSALDMAANLIFEICGGQISSVVEAGSSKINETKIDFDLNKIPQILGIEIATSQIKAILLNLGFKIKENKDNKLLQVTVPSFRSDVTIAEDLIEEIIRIYGYSQISAAILPDFAEQQPQVDDNRQTSLEAIRSTLCASHMDEIISWSFISSKIAKLFSSLKTELFINNPISVDMDYMRPSLLPGLLAFTAKNQLRGFNNLAVFEIGKIFQGIDANQQNNNAAGLRVGKNKEKSLYKDQRDFDCLDVKKDFFDCLEKLGIKSKSAQITNDDIPGYYHPYRCSTVKLGKNIIGRFGELHPILNKKLDINGRINAFELFIEALPNKNNKKNGNMAFITYDLPAVTRDFAFILEQKVKIADLIKLVENCQKELINKVDIFDIYQGDKIDKDKKSVALTIKIQPKVQTLTSEEIEQISNKIINNVAEKLGGIVRDGNR